MDSDFPAWSLELHGHEVIYRTAGSGPPVVIVHGMVNSSKHWRDVALRLAETHTVIVPDLIGHGDTAAVRGDYSIGAHAAVIRDLLSAIGIESATFVGHSLGGGIAMQFFYQFPYKVERLALVSSGGLGQEVSPMLRGAALPGAAGIVWAASHRSVLGVLDGIAAAGGKAGWRNAVYLRAVTRALRPLQDPGARQAFLQSLRSVIDIHGQKVSAVDRLYLLGPVETLIVWGEKRPHDPDPARHRRPRADPALAHGDAAARRALPEPRGSGRPRRRPRPLARRDEAVRPLRRGLVRAHRLEARPRPAPARGLSRQSSSRILVLARRPERPRVGPATRVDVEARSGARHQARLPRGRAALHLKPAGRREAVHSFFRLVSAHASRIADCRAVRKTRYRTQTSP